MSFKLRFAAQSALVATTLTVIALLVVAAPLTSSDIVLAPELIVVPEPEPIPLRFSATVTAYSSSPDETWGDPFTTASGRRVFDGLVACPREFPFGTKFKIGNDTYLCFDRLHQKFDDRFDIWMSTKNAAKQFGKQQLVVEVL